MLAVKDHIELKEKGFELHPFFARLNAQDDFSEGMAFVPRLMFWVMVFQDILNIIPPQVKSAHLRRIATHHKHEDAGHDKWFLEDIAYLEKKHILTIEWLFSPEHKITRDVAYRIISEAFHGKDHQKIILILALESTGHIFFRNIAQFVKNKGHEANLKYLSSYHLDVEMNHAVFEEKLKEDLFSIVLSPEEREEAVAMVDRIYDAFNTLFDYLLEPSKETNEQQ
ncbi:MAG: hypothetical protein K0R76_525 [Alphaproteobacteria bacterium]|jgi:hypothetical protein|nr:hypothetical protein [Alphaproteobacteria bacterium]MDF3033571.1 hypothetical protein [Alphaproteobacteria bacterium]